MPRECDSRIYHITHHFEDLRDGTHGGSATPKDKEAPFREGSATAGSHRAPGSHRNKQELAAQHRQLTETGLRRIADGGLKRIWVLSWPEQRAAGIDPIMLQPISRALPPPSSSRDDSSRLACASPTILSALKIARSLPRRLSHLDYPFISRAPRISPGRTPAGIAVIY